MSEIRFTRMDELNSGDIHDVIRELEQTCNVMPTPLVASDCKGFSCASIYSNSSGYGPKLPVSCVSVAQIGKRSLLVAVASAASMRHPSARRRSIPVAMILGWRSVIRRCVVRISIVPGLGCRIGVSISASGEGKHKECCARKRAYDSSSPSCVHCPCRRRLHLLIL